VIIPLRFLLLASMMIPISLKVSLVGLNSFVATPQPCSRVLLRA
jgi:hypothetical protein